MDGFVAWQALVDGYAPKSSNDPAVALQPILATPKRCKDAKELKERLTAWSLKVAEYEHQFKVIDEAQKILVVREMMPKDIKREFLAGPRKFDDIMEKLEPMDLGNVGAYDAKTGHEQRHVTRRRVCHRLERLQVRTMDREHGIVEKELMNGRVAGEMTEPRKEAKKGSKGSKLDWHGDKDKGGNGSKGKGKGKGKSKSETRYCYDCGEQGHIGLNCPYKWANSIDEYDQTSSWESEPEGENVGELASLEAPDEEGEWCRPKEEQSHLVERR